MSVIPITTIPEDYIPFGPEWEKEMMKVPKKYLIELLRKELKAKADSQTNDKVEQPR